MRREHGTSSSQFSALFPCMRRMHVCASKQVLFPRPHVEEKIQPYFKSKHVPVVDCPIGRCAGLSSTYSDIHTLKWKYMTGCHRFMSHKQYPNYKILKVIVKRPLRTLLKESFPTHPSIPSIFPRKKSNFYPPTSTIVRFSKSELQHQTPKAIQLSKLKKFSH